MIEKYFSIEKETTNTIVIERSKFITYIAPISSEEEASEYLSKIKKEHSLATHWCYAFIIGENCLNQKFSDDGEPSGTAGLPILEALKHKNLTNVVCVVVRYFGGVKLGTGGLIRAYSGSANSCLNVSKILCYNYSNVYNLEISYDFYSKILKIIDEIGAKTLLCEFLNQIKIQIAVKNSYTEKFINLISESFNGKLSPEKVGEDYYPFKE